MISLKQLIISAALIVSANFINAQGITFKENFRANYVYVQGASNNVAFINKSTGNYSASEWSFGDGNTASSKNAVHEYKTPGYYLLRLVVSNETQNSDTLYQIINVHNLNGVNSYANKNQNNESSFILSARSNEALFECFDKFFADAVLLDSKVPTQKQKKVLVPDSW